MKLIDAVYEVLKDSCVPMGAHALERAVCERRLFETHGKTLHASIGAAIYTDIKELGAASRFVKCGKGQFAVAESAAAKARIETPKGKGGSKQDLQAEKGLQIMGGKKCARKNRSGAGFVYIMTNPSFRKSWIKIGYTAVGETVEQRRRQLSNSSVPYPFEVFATLRSSNAYDTEQRVHLALEAGGDSRLTPNREFFDLSPDRALKAFKAIASEEAIDIYRDGKVVAHGLDIPVVKEKKRNRKTSAVAMPQADVLRCTASGADAKGVERSGAFVVLRGSRLAKISPSMSKYAKAAYELRRQLEKEGVIVDGVLGRQQSFPSLWVAACFVAGRNAHGTRNWRTADGKSLTRK